MRLRDARTARRCACVEVTGRRRPRVPGGGRLADRRVHATVPLGRRAGRRRPLGAVLAPRAPGAGPADLRGQRARRAGVGVRGGSRRPPDARTAPGARADSTTTSGHSDWAPAAARSASPTRSPPSSAPNQARVPSSTVEPADDHRRPQARREPALGPAPAGQPLDHGPGAEQDERDAGGERVQGRVGLALAAGQREQRDGGARRATDGVPHPSGGGGPAQRQRRDHVGGAGAGDTQRHHPAVVGVERRERADRPGDLVETVLLQRRCQRPAADDEAPARPRR